jgi:hypothetical protein
MRFLLVRKKLSYSLRLVPYRSRRFMSHFRIHGLFLVLLASLLAVATSGSPLTITTNGSLGTATIGQVQIPLNASGGSGNYTWSLASGSLPTGLNIAPIPGSSPAQIGFVGIASSAGNYSFSLTVNDGSTTVTQAFYGKDHGAHREGHQSSRCVRQFFLFPYLCALE